MSDERKKFVIEFTDFINNNFEFLKSMYKLFKNGKSEMIINNKEVSIESENFDKLERPKDTVYTTLLFAYMSMKQLKNPHDEMITLNDDEIVEFHNYVEYVKEKCDIERKLEGNLE